MTPRAGDSAVDLHQFYRLFPASKRFRNCSPPEHLQPGLATYVNRFVKEWNSTMKPMAGSSTRRFVKVAPPSVHAGLGDALRQAFRMDGERRSLVSFEELLARLD